MDRKTSTIMSLGISVALIAGAIWFLYEQHHRFGYIDGPWGMPHQTMMGGGYMGIFMLLFWVALIAVIALMVSGAISGRSSSPKERQPMSPDALEVLKRRYAKGEIDKAQYQDMKREIEQ
jgi:putative membrane protein